MWQTARMLVAAFAALLSINAPTARAGEWVPVGTGDSPLSALTYQSDKMLPGEELTLFYTGMKRGFGLTGGDDAYKYSAFILKIILQTAGGPFTGFGGVDLRHEGRGETTMVLQAPPVPGGRVPSLVESDCGDAQTGTIPALALGNNYSDVQPTCANACFRTLADLQAEANPVSCDSGEGNWIMSYLMGALTEEIGERWRYDAVHGAEMLIVRAMTSEYEWIRVPLDDAFRDALWSDRGLSQEDIWRQQIAGFAISSLDRCGGSPSLPSYGASDWEIESFNSDAQAWVACVKAVGNANIDNVNALKSSLDADGCCTEEVVQLLNAQVGRVNEVVDTANAWIEDFNDRINRHNDNVESNSGSYDSGGDYAPAGGDSYSSYDDGYSSYDDGESYDSGGYESYDSGSGYSGAPFDMPTYILPGMN
ncbi:MAG: hypothetical protein KDE06_14560 [Rhodobacteraceae bacterium]|nr:hypothetical protein [Paracoccaceae bacterium]MCB2139434.1 hypothetical protein [Paracoccaceae bacterium]MCB2152235.1 hypothetical protein [Paracoccaceae bacterium]MCC0045828.1 hypothetical protein [Defluviimonas sp.]